MSRRDIRPSLGTRWSLSEALAAHRGCGEGNVLGYLQELRRDDSEAEKFGHDEVAEDLSLALIELGG